MMSILLLADYHYKMYRVNLCYLLWKEKNMTREELYEIMEGNPGYAYVYEIENSNKHIEFMFDMTPENIANFIGKNAYTADKV